jgi:hypothetical protein
MSTCFEANRPISLTEIENVDGVSVVQIPNGYFLISGDDDNKPDSVISIDEVDDRDQFTDVTRYGLNDADSILVPIEETLGVKFVSEYQKHYWR